VTTARPDLVLIATRPALQGTCAALLHADGTSLLRRLHDHLGVGASTRVVTRSVWLAEVVADLPGDVEVVAADTGPDVLAAVLAAPATPGRDLLLLDAGTVADPHSLDRIGDRAAAGTRVVALPGATGDPLETAAGLRATRGRVVAAGSHLHAVTSPDSWHGRGLRLAARDRDGASELRAPLATLLTEGGAEDVALADPLPLVTVAVVRAGIPLAPVTPLPGGVWRVVDAPTDAVAATQAVEASDLEALRLRAAVKAEDGFFTTFFVSTYSRYLARWAAVRGFTPDQVTATSMLLGVLAALGFASGERAGWVAGAVALQLAFALDCVDGQLARYARVSTPRGAWLDAVFDRGKEYVAYLGLAIGGVRAGDDRELWVLAAAALTLQTVRHVVDLGYDTQQRADAAAAARVPLEQRTDGPVSRWEPASLATPADVDRPDPADAATATGPRRGTRTRLRAGIAGLRRGESVGLVRWGKRIVVLPIGERFALISVVVAVASPRAVFLWLLAWGTLAAAYTTGGRIVRSVA
jgi:phosphatidylglycerophosphate synthase